jgi:hypothetical protein
MWYIICSPLCLEIPLTCKPQRVKSARYSVRTTYYLEEFSVIFINSLSHMLRQYLALLRSASQTVVHGRLVVRGGPQAISEEKALSE